MVEVRAKDNEKLDSLLRRFKRKLQLSRDQITARQKRFFESPKNKRAQKDDAIRRSKIRAERDHLGKIGKLPPKTTPYNKGRK
ncbi:MAG: 30S ribosomal protein S21 [bacterium]